MSSNTSSRFGDLVVGATLNSINSSHERLLLNILKEMKYIPQSVCDMYNLNVLRSNGTVENNWMFNGKVRVESGRVFVGVMKSRNEKFVEILTLVRDNNIKCYTFLNEIVQG